MKILWTLLNFLLAVDGRSSSRIILEEWSLFKLQFNKSYANEVEENFRMNIFMDNKKEIAKHNARYERGEVSYNLAMNHFGDMLHHEFVSTMNGFKHSRHLLHGAGRVTATNANLSVYIEPATVQLSEEVDWRVQGAVTGVKNQGLCGSCWAFSSTGALEGQHFRKTGTLTSLSEQNLIDCTRKYGNSGCNGGVIDYAFQYVKDINGIDTESSYPYEARDGQCRFNPQASGATDSGFVDVPQGDEGQLRAAVATVGPVSVAIDASHESFRFYKSGVYYESACNSNKLDHAVLVVGYGTEYGFDYWLLKNSWDTWWGDQGYMKMARNKNNHCGIATAASYPLV